MADFKLALPYILHQEVIGWPKEADGSLCTDIAAGMAHVQALGHLHFWFTDTPGDLGGATAWGIDLACAQAHGIGSVEDLRQITAEKVAMVYRADFWRFDSLTDQSLATKLMDESVNMGPGNAIRILQESLSTLGVPLKVDGCYGPNTEMATNASNAAGLMAMLCEGAADYYHARVIKNHSQAQFLPDWLRRAQERP